MGTLVLTWMRLFSTTRDDDYEPGVCVFSIVLDITNIGIGILYCTRVSIMINSDEQKIGFKFHHEKLPNSLSLYTTRGEKAFSNKGLASQYDWIKTVISLPRDQRRFKPVRETVEGESVWVVQIPRG